MHAIRCRKRLTARWTHLTLAPWSGYCLTHAHNHHITRAGLKQPWSAVSALWSLVRTVHTRSILTNVKSKRKAPVRNLVLCVFLFFFGNGYCLCLLEYTVYSEESMFNTENGLNPGITYLGGNWSSGWNESWEAQQHQQLRGHLNPFICHLSSQEMSLTRKVKRHFVTLI